MSERTHQEMLQKYAEAIVKVGLNLRAGQRLIITLAVNRGVPIQFAPLVREVVKAAYGGRCKICGCDLGRRGNPSPACPAMLPVMPSTSILSGLWMPL